MANIAIIRDAYGIPAIFVGSKTGREDAPFVFVRVGGEEHRMRWSEWDSLPAWTGETRRGPSKANFDEIPSMTITRLGIWTVALLVTSALGAFAASAVAPNCRAIESANARLSCYDAAFPPKTQNPAEAGAVVPRGYKDPFLAEEARTAAKLKNICRGC